MKYTVEMSSTTDFAAKDILKSVDLNNRLTTQYTFTDLMPETQYFFRMKISDSGGLEFTSPSISGITLKNIPPTIDIIEPDGINDVVNTSFVIKWVDSDPDDNATINLFYYHDLLGENPLGVVKEGEDGISDSFTWDTTNLREGEFTIKLVINDTINLPVIEIGDFKVVVDHHKDQSPPELREFYPFDMEVGIENEEVSIYDAIYLIFNEPLDVSSINGKISLHSDMSGEVTGTIDYNQSSQKITFKPELNLELDTWHTVILAGGIADIFGNVNASSFSWKFKTTPIEIDLIDPEAGADDVSINDDLKILFSETMNITSVEQRLYMVPSTVILQYNWSLNNSFLTIRHDGLKSSTLYSLFFGQGVSSKSGKVLSKTREFSFKTKYELFPPEILDYGYFNVDGSFIFYIEYSDENNESPGTAKIHLFKNGEFHKTEKMIIINRDIEDKISLNYQPESLLKDGYFNNSELFVAEIVLEEGKYEYYFEFSDFNGTQAVGDDAPLSRDNTAEGPEVHGETDDSSIIVMVALIILVVIIIIIIVTFWYLPGKAGKKTEDMELETDIDEMDDNDELVMIEPVEDDEDMVHKLAPEFELDDDEETDENEKESKTGPGEKIKNRKKSGVSKKKDLGKK
jgi:hypothetical protein